MERARVDSVASSLGARRVADLQRFKNVLVVVCGGATATPEEIRAWAAKLA